MTDAERLALFPDGLVADGLAVAGRPLVEDAVAEALAAADPVAEAGALECVGAGRPVVGPAVGAVEAALVGWGVRTPGAVEAAVVGLGVRTPGAVAGLNVATDSIAPATRHTASTLASSGITVPCPAKGPATRRSRSRRRLARISRR